MKNLTFLRLVALLMCLCVVGIVLIGCSTKEPPADPDEPDVPADPDEPDVPAEPEEPDVPAEPEEPDAPAEPEEPDAPAEPEEPDVPAEPEEPDVPAEPEEPDVPAVEPQILIIDNCDVLGAVDNAIPLTLNTAPEFIKEGTGSYLSEGHARSNGNEIFVLRGQWDLSPYMENGYIHLWVYFTDAETFKTVNFEVTSSGKCDVQELTFFTVHFKDLKQGWNEIVLPFAEASKVMEDFDPSSANYIRMFTITEDNTWGDYYIDDIYVSLGE